MDLTRIRALRGPNLWSRHTAMEAIVRCDGDEVDITRLADFETRLRSLFPGIGALPASGQRTVLSLAHVLESAALALQNQAGCPVTFSRTSATVEPGVFQMVVEYSEEPVGRLALELAEQLVRAALEPAGQGSFDVLAALAPSARDRRGRAPRPVHRLDRRRRRPRVAFRGGA